MDWRTWSPFQSKITREICRNMTEEEKSCYSFRKVWDLECPDGGNPTHFRTFLSQLFLDTCCDYFGNSSSLWDSSLEKKTAEISLFNPLGNVKRIHRKGSHPLTKK